MSELQLTHIALVGARMSSFRALGYGSRNEFAMARVVPPLPDESLDSMSPESLREHLRGQLPLWVHNIITDPEFPRREKLLMPLRRFEGELNDGKRDEVISAVLSHGFQDEDFDPLALPADLPMRERCAIVAHIDVWSSAWLRLQGELLDILAREGAALRRWCDFAGHPDHRMVE